MASTLKLNFSSPANVGDTLSININSPTGSIVLTETYKTLRQANGQVTAPNIGVLAAYYSALNYVNAWNLDYKNTGGTNNITASINESTWEVTLSMENDSWEFNPSTPISGSLPTASKVSYVLNNSTLQPVSTLAFVDYNMTTSTCGNLVANFSAAGGTGIYDIYVNNSLTLAGQGANFSLNLNRGVNYSIRVVDSAGMTIKTISFKPPRNLIANDLTVSVDNLDSGATLTIEDTFISASIYPLEYSLDGITYKTDNYFTGIASGDYTLYVKDAFGCSVEKTFNVDGITTLTQTIFTLSNLNAIRYANVEEGKKNHLNTLSSNELKGLQYTYAHKYLLEDSLTTQFKTNAAYMNAYAIDSKFNTTQLSIIKQTNNTNQQIKTTATLFSSNGLMGIYFGVVDEVDYTTEAVIGSVDYGFSLPEWANKVGNYVTISGVGQVKILDIQYSEERDAFVLIFNLINILADEQRFISAIHNIQPYEVYEFTADMSVLPEIFNIVVEVGISANDIQFTRISEKIKRVVDSDKLYLIEYKNSSNKGDMVYQTGISHKIRLEGFEDDDGDQETEGYDGDQEFYVTDNSIYDAQRFVFKYLSSEVARMLRGVVAHDSLIINGLGYKLADVPEISPSFNSNLKTFSVNLKRGGNVFLDSSQEIISGSAEIESISGAIEASKGKSLLLWTKS
jgi:hypothetical protein